MYAIGRYSLFACLGSLGGYGQSVNPWAIPSYFNVYEEMDL